MRVRTNPWCSWDITIKFLFMFQRRLLVKLVNRCIPIWEFQLIYHFTSVLFQYSLVVANLICIVNMMHLEHCWKEKENKELRQLSRLKNTFFLPPLSSTSLSDFKINIFVSMDRLKCKQELMNHVISLIEAKELLTIKLLSFICFYLHLL